MKNYWFLILLFFFSCKNGDGYKQMFGDPELYSKTVHELNEVVMGNNFPPIVASRNYTYAAIAGYEVMVVAEPARYRTLAGQIHGLDSLPIIQDTAGVYFVPAFSGLFAPYWRSDARGAIVGLTRAATKAHLARAALEAICYQTRDVMDAMVADSGVPMSEMRVDGGITANSLCMQMQADIMGIDITRPLIGETTALGAAYAAGLAVGFWSSQDEVKKQWQQSRRWSPTSTLDVREAGYKQWKKAVERTLNWVD